MNYNTYYKLNDKILKALDYYALKNDCVNDSYYISKILLEELAEGAYRNKEILETAGKWLNGGSTLVLINALKYTRHDDNNIDHFNARDLLDTVSLYI